MYQLFRDRLGTGFEARIALGMAKSRIVSSDDHVFEPADLWTSRMAPKFSDRAPHIARLEDGSDWWFCDGVRGQNTGIGAQAGRRFEEPQALSLNDQYENVRPGAYIPGEHVKDMDLDGIDVSIIYPTAGLMHYSIRDSELVTAVFRTYNDWIAEFCDSFPSRLKGIGMLNIDDVQAGVQEMERCARLGLVGAMVPVYPPEEVPYDSPEYEPIWAAAQDLGLPLSLHINTIRPGPSQIFTDNLIVKPADLNNVDHWVRMSLSHIIFSGVFERYPKLRVGSVEMELSWAPHFLDRADYTYTQTPLSEFLHRFGEDMLPSDYFRRNVFLSFQEDSLGIRERHVMGVDNLLWGSDYPHFESTFPRSLEILERILTGCDEVEKAKIAGGNASRIYRLD